VYKTAVTKCQQLHLYETREKESTILDGKMKWLYTKYWFDWVLLFYSTKKKPS